MKLRELLIQVAEDAAGMVLAKLLGKLKPSDRAAVEGAIAEAVQAAIRARFAAMDVAEAALDAEVEHARHVKPYPWMEGMEVERVEPTGHERIARWPPRDDEHE